MKTIEIPLSVDGCTKALKTLEKYKADIKPKLDEVCRRLAELGAEEARRILGTVDPMEGNTDATVSTRKLENGWAITMSGSDVYFIEFGTGDRAGVLSPWYDEVPADARPGSWSETHAQQYSTQGYWYFGGKRYEFTEPHPAFYDAYQAMVEALPQIAQEVFGK